MAKRTAAGTNSIPAKKCGELKNYLYLLPGVLFIVIFFVSSIIYTIFLSFHEWDGFSEMKFVGLDNYVTLFSDSNFLISVMNTMIWVVGSLFVSLLIPLIMAILIYNSSSKTIYKNIFYFPSAISGTIGGLIIASLLSTYGLPQVFGLLGMEKLVCDWLAIPYVNTFVMIGSSVWQGIGLNMMLFLVGLNNMDASPLEAAEIEGANTFQMYTRVIFPLLRPTFIVVLLMSLVNSFKVFDSIWVMTKGGPYRTSETLALTMYQESFIKNQLGNGAAVAVVLTIVVMFVSYLNLRNSFGEDSNGHL